MKGTVLAEPSVRKILAGFVTAELYTDRNREEDRANRRLQEERFRSAALPLYVTLGPDGQERSRLEGLSTRETFIEFLKKGLDASGGGK